MDLLQSLTLGERVFVSIIFALWLCAVLSSVTSLLCMIRGWLNRRCKSPELRIFLNSEPLRWSAFDPRNSADYGLYAEKCALTGGRMNHRLIGDKGQYVGNVWLDEANHLHIALSTDWVTDITFENHNRPRVMKMPGQFLAPDGSAPPPKAW